MLTAFERGASDYVVHRSEDGKSLGGGSATDYYAGSSRVIAMIPYKDGVHTAFDKGKNEYVIHWSKDGKNLGGGNPFDYYVGGAPVTAMTPYKEGVLTAFK